MAQIVITMRGSNLSVNLPIAMASKPFTIAGSENAPDVVALVQPNSPAIGFRKTPQLKYAPHIAAITKNDATKTR